MHRLWIGIALAVLAHGEIVDRIAITVGITVIAESQINEELGVTALLNRKPLDQDSAARRAAANRLIMQILVRQEMDLSHFPLPSAAETERYFDQVRATYDSQDGFAQALAASGLSGGVLREHLTLQLMMLRFIEYRFRPEAAVTAADVQKRTDDALDAWLAATRKQVHIRYLDASLE